MAHEVLIDSGVAFPCPVIVFSKRDIQYIMQGVLDGPVAADGGFYLFNLSSIERGAEKPALPASALAGLLARFCLATT